MIGKSQHPCHTKFPPTSAESTSMHDNYVFCNYCWLFFFVLLSFGGFPSSHTAFITALSVSILVLQLHEGKLDYTFSLALGLGAIVVYDSLGLRYIRKDHDKILDEISSAGDFRENDLMKFHFGIRKKRDYTRNIYYRGIMAGVILGIIVSLLCCLIII